MITREQVIEKLKEVFDPELGLDVWTLEIIYDIIIVDNIVNIKMTFTTPFCPYGASMVQDIQNKVEELEGVKVNIEVTFDPPWKPSDKLLDMMAMGIR